MSYDMNAQGSSQMLPPMMHLMNQGGVPFCNKHDAVLNSYCMSHQLPLCHACIPEHFQLLAQSGHNMQNTPQDQMGRSAAQGQNCELLPMDRAIQESLQRMKSSLTSVQDFIEFKKSFVDFPDESTLQMFLPLNQNFEQAYNQAHRHLTNLQNMPSGQKELNLSSLNQQFFDEYKRLITSRSNIEALIQRIQASQTGHAQRGPSPLKQPMHAQGSLQYNGQPDHSGYLDQAQMIQHPQQQQMHPQQDIFSSMFKQHQPAPPQQQAGYSQMHLQQNTNASSYEQQNQQKQTQGQFNPATSSQYHPHPQMQQSVVPQQQKPTAATSHFQTPQSNQQQQQQYGQQVAQQEEQPKLMAMNNAQSANLHAMQGPSQQQPAQINQQPSAPTHQQQQLPAPNRQTSASSMPQQTQMGMHTESGANGGVNEDFFNDGKRHMPAVQQPLQNVAPTTLPPISHSHDSSSGMISAPPMYQQQKQQQQQQQAAHVPSQQVVQQQDNATRQQFAAIPRDEGWIAESDQRLLRQPEPADSRAQNRNQRIQEQENLLLHSSKQVNYNRKKHWGLQLHVCVDLDDQRSRQGVFEQDISSNKTYDFEVEIEPTSSLKSLRQRIKEDMMRSGVISDPKFIDMMNVYHAEGVHRQNLNQNILPSVSSAASFRPLNNQPGQTFEDLAIKQGSTILFTVNQRASNSPHRHPRRRDSSSGERFVSHHAGHQMQPSQIPANQGQLGSPENQHQPNMLSQQQAMHPQHQTYLPQNQQPQHPGGRQSPMLEQQPLPSLPAPPTAPVHQHPPPAIQQANQLVMPSNGGAGPLPTGLINGVINNDSINQQQQIQSTSQVAQIGTKAGLPSVKDDQKVAKGPKASDGKLVRRPAPGGSKAKEVELDENGNPIKKQRAKKAPKEIRQIEIFYRLAKKTQVAVQTPPVVSNDEAAQPDEANFLGDEENKEAVVVPQAEVAVAPEQINTQVNTQVNAQVVAKSPDTEPFLRSVIVNDKARLKVIKKAILEQLGVEGMCALRVYAFETTYQELAPEKEKAPIPAANPEGEAPVEKKEEEEAVVQNYTPGDLYFGEMSSLKELGLLDGGKVEVEVFFTLEVSVLGKGSGYQTKVEVSPNEKMEAIRTKVPFFKIFVQRRYQIYAPEADRVFEESELSQLLFRDVGLHNGSKLVLREPERVKPSEADVEVGADASDSDENEMAADDEAEAGENVRSMLSNFGEGGAEGGEDEMIEFEGGEDEIVEMGFAGEQEKEADEQPIEQEAVAMQEDDKPMETPEDVAADDVAPEEMVADDVEGEQQAEEKKDDGQDAPVVE